MPRRARRRKVVVAKTLFVVKIRFCLVFGGDDVAVTVYDWR